MMERLPLAPTKATLKMRVVLVCGTKYGFRSIYVPVLRRLSHFALIRVYLLDFPEEYESGPVLQDLQGLNNLEACFFIPSPRYWLRHHRALGAMCRSLKRERVDLLVLDGDFTPMHQYFINVARSKNAVSVALQKDVPKKLFVSYEAAISRKRGSESPSTPTDSKRQRIKELAVILIRGPDRLAVIMRRLNYLRLLWRRSVHFIVNYWLLPLLFSCRAFTLYDYERRGLTQFASIRVDAIIVYTERIREALHYFFPHLNVLVAQHPLAENCRCDGPELKSKLLVTLGGPWKYYIGPDNPAPDIEERWLKAIMRAIELKGFSEVHIRPHPRETERYPYGLVRRLRDHGVVAEVTDSRVRTISAIICDYAGVLGAPSGALLEAAVSCQRAFVVGLENIQGVQGDSFAVPVQDYSPNAISVPRGYELKEEHFTRIPEPNCGKRSVCDVLQALANDVVTKAGYRSLSVSDIDGSSIKCGK